MSEMSKDDKSFGITWMIMLLLVAVLLWSQTVAPSNEPDVQEPARNRDQEYDQRMREMG